MPVVFSSALAAALHCALLIGGAELICRGVIAERNALTVNVACAFVSCLAVSAGEGRGAEAAPLRRGVLLSALYCALLLLLSAIARGRIMDNGVTPLIWTGGTAGAILGKGSRLGKSNKSYRIGLKKR